MELEIKVNSELNKYQTQTKSELYMFESRFNKIESLFAEAKSERHDMLFKFEKQRTEHTFLVDAFTSLEDRVKNFETAVNERFEKIEARFDRLEERFDHLEERFDHLEERFDHLEERFDRLEERFDRLEERFDHLAARFDRLESIVLKVVGHFNIKI